MDRTKAAEILHKAKVCYATEYLDCHMVCDMCKYHVEDSLVVEAIDTAIKALDKDIDVPSKSALDHIHNVVAENAFNKGYDAGHAEGYERGKKDTATLLAKRIMTRFDEVLGVDDVLEEIDNL